MQPATLHQLVGSTDIYLLDQILKMRYRETDKIFDAGCGYGKNLPWFMATNIAVYGIDQEQACVSSIQQRYPDAAGRFYVADLSQMPFDSAFFDHVICSAVLHFAASRAHFLTMFAELLRVLKPGGSLFIRMTSSIGIEERIVEKEEGNFVLPDGSTRFLVSRQFISDLVQQFQLVLLEPIKTVNVADIRCMTTLVMMKPPLLKDL